MSEEVKLAGPHRKWPPEDEVRLAALWPTRTPLKVLVDEFPGRSVRGLQSKAMELGLPRRRIAKGISETRPAFVALWAELVKKRGTRMQLAARVGVSNQTAGDFIQYFRARMRIVGWHVPADGQPAPIFAAGAGVDKPKPAKKARAQIYSDYWKRMKRERPEQAAARIARANFLRLERQGKLMKRDPAAVAMFGGTGTALRE
jgi:hypothetical protein